MSSVTETITSALGKQGEMLGARLWKTHLTGVKLQATLCLVKIRNIVHRGLKRLYMEDAAKGVPAKMDCPTITCRHAEGRPSAPIPISIRCRCMGR